MQPFLLKPDTQSNFRRGLSKEYTGSEKAPIALQIAASQYADWQDYRVSVTDVVVDSINETKNGDKIAKRYANNTYYVHGSAKFWFRHQAKDAVLEPKVLQWYLEFTDALEPSYGTPDLKALKFTVEASPT